jgi:hypothetical protein
VDAAQTDFDREHTGGCSEWMNLLYFRQAIGWRFDTAPEHPDRDKQAYPHPEQIRERRPGGEKR